MIRALIFDLDDTLYPEWEFVVSGYRSVAQHLGRSYDCPFDAVMQTMELTFQTHGRREVFPAVIRQFLDPSFQMADLVKIYRQHKPEIRLFPGYGALMDDFRRSYRTGIITDGVSEVQRNKVAALNLERQMDYILYTWDYGLEKPHPAPFSLMMEKLGVDSTEALFVGDNPEKDCRGAHAVGMKFAQVVPANREQVNSCLTGDCRAEFIIESLFQLPGVLMSME
jgi:putative hydrolase of the HAD superfamily